MRRLLILAILLVSSTARAEPGPTINWLMNEPMSLWDWGMVSLKEDVRLIAQSIDKDESEYVVLLSDVSYSRHTDRIDIVINLGTNDSRFATASECTMAWELARFYMILTVDGITIEEEIENYFERHFSHPGGYPYPALDQSIGQTLSEIAYLHMEIRTPIVARSEALNSICFGRLIDEAPVNE